MEEAADAPPHLGQAVRLEHQEADDQEAEDDGAHGREEHRVLRAVGQQVEHELEQLGHHGHEHRAENAAQDAAQHPADDLAAHFAADGAGCTLDELLAHAGARTAGAATQHVANAVQDAATGGRKMMVIKSSANAITKPLLDFDIKIVRPGPCSKLCG